MKGWSYSKGCHECMMLKASLPGGFLFISFLFALTQKETKKSRTTRMAPPVCPAHATVPLYLLRCVFQHIPFFRIFLYYTQFIFLSVAVWLSERPKSKNTMVEILRWKPERSSALNLMRFLFAWTLASKSRITNVQATVVLKLNQGTIPYPGCNRIRGSFFVSSERSRRIWRSKKEK